MLKARQKEVKIVQTMLWAKQQSKETPLETELLKDPTRAHKARVEVWKKPGVVVVVSDNTSQACSGDGKSNKKVKPALKDWGPAKVVFHRPDFDYWDSLEVSA